MYGSETSYLLAITLINCSFKVTNSTIVLVIVGVNKLIKIAKLP